MAPKIPHSPRRGSQRFQTVADAFLGGEGLPFAEILSAERIQRIFAKHGCLFGLHGVYTAAIVEPGRRTTTIDIITTLVDAEVYTTEDIAELYGFRWNAELDIRCIKTSLNLGHVRCKSPEMVHREVWTTILGYHLIRTTAAGAALVHGKQPRQISFTSTCQYVLASWMQLSGGLIDASLLQDYLWTMLKQIAACEVANRPGRLEPRVLKRRRHGYPLMQKPRAELRKHCT